MTVQLSYTLCFVLHHDRILLLNRECSPNLGLWNGLGGKIDAGVLSMWNKGSWKRRCGKPSWSFDRGSLSTYNEGKTITG